MSRDGLLPASAGQDGEHGTPVRLTIDRRRASSRSPPRCSRSQARGDGQRRHPVRLRAGVGRRDRAAPDAARPAPRASGCRWCRWLPIAAIVACLWLMLNLTALTWVRFLVWMAIGDGGLLPLRPAALGARAAGDRDFGVIYSPPASVKRARFTGRGTVRRAVAASASRCSAITCVVTTGDRRSPRPASAESSRRCRPRDGFVRDTGGGARAACTSSTIALSPMSARIRAAVWGYGARAAASGLDSGVVARR